MLLDSVPSSVKWGNYTFPILPYPSSLIFWGYFLFIHENILVILILFNKN